jgi:hypothetical protein
MRPVPVAPPKQRWHSVRVRPNRFDERIAAGYGASTDISEAELVDPVVDSLASLAGDGCAVEIAVGTDRIKHVPVREKVAP